MVDTIKRLRPRQIMLDPGPGSAGNLSDLSAGSPTLRLQKGSELA